MIRKLKPIKIKNEIHVNTLASTKIHILEIKKRMKNVYDFPGCIDNTIHICISTLIL